MRVALTCCALEWEEHGAAEEAEMDDAHKKGFILRMLCIFQFQVFKRSRVARRGKYCVPTAWNIMQVCLEKTQL